MRTSVYIVALILILQVTLGRMIPDAWVYHYRVDYETIKNSMGPGLDRAMEHVANHIKRHPDEEYVVLLGDSVTYSGPGGPEQSIGYYMEAWSREQGHPMQVYNFAQPGMAAADIYAVLLMLQAHQIPLKRVVINQVYANFVAGKPGDPQINWLQDELRTRDPEAWRIVHAEALPAKAWTSQFRQAFLGNIALWRYRDLLRTHLLHALHLSASGELKDLRPWYEKKLWLTSLMKQPAYQLWVDPRPFNMTDTNPHLQIMERMFAHLKGAQVLVFFSPFNHDLLSTENPGYQENLKRIDGWFANQPVNYVNLNNAIATDLFVDHTHLVAEGYRQLAAILGRRLAQLH